MTTADPLAGSTLDRRYYVESRLAEGGMATVYVAHDVRLDRRVALKVMHAQLAGDPQFVRRFIGEAHSVAKLSHPNVAQVYDQGTDQGYVYLAMEYVPGRTLRDLLTERGRLAPREALDVMGPVLAGLGAAHRAGLVHRDVKPENVLLTTDGQVKVVDFGLARAVEESQQGLTKTGSLIGTVAYLAPEQISQSVSDARTDVYASGVMLYELLTGQQPHRGDTPIAVAYQHVNEDVPRPSRVIAGIPPRIDTLVTRATERDPDYRPRDAGQFLASLFEVYQSMPDSGAHASVNFAPAAAEIADAPTTAQAAPASENGNNDTLVVDLDDPDVPEPHDATEQYSDRRRLFALLGGGALLIVLLGLGWWFFLGRYETVPDLVGLGEDEARSVANERSLRIEVSDDPVYSDEVEEGQIARTAPEAQERILPDEPIIVRLSQGPRTVEVPDVAGKSAEEASADLEEAGFGEVERQDEESYDEPAGTALRTVPAAGETADRDEPIELVVSSGFGMPSVVGAQEGEARALLEDNGLEVTVTEGEDDDAEEGEVIAQEPANGESVSVGDTVTLTVAGGPEEIEIPDISGMRVEEARERLEELGFEVEVHEFFGDRVFRYSPEGEAPEGTTVEIWASPIGGEDGNGGEGNPGGGPPGEDDD